MPAGNRFITLDALRGVAALAILFYHSMPGSPLVFSGGYLAVDLFFGLSGFVIALTYQDRLRDGMGMREFLTLRAIRLWPMLLVGAVLGIALHAGHAGMLFLLPNPFSDALYPSNPPFWSLVFEALAYLVFSAFAFRLRTRTLLGLLLLSAAVLAAFVGVRDARLEEFGAFWSTVPAGLARLCFSFTAGIMIYRLRSAQGMLSTSDWRAWLLLAGLAAVLWAVPASGSGPGLVAILAIFPAIIWLATLWVFPFPGLANALGALSYPLYCIHVPILALGVAVGSSKPLAWGLLIAASLLLDRYCDRPARRWLTGFRARSALRRASA